MGTIQTSNLIKQYLRVTPISESSAVRDIFWENIRSVKVLQTQKSYNLLEDDIKFCRVRQVGQKKTVIH